MQRRKRAIGPSPTKATLLIERAAKALGGCPNGALFSLTALGLCSAPRLVLMRCMASREVVLLTGHFFLLRRVSVSFCVPNQWVEETLMCPVGKVPLSHNFLRPIFHSLAKHVSSQMKGRFRG